MTRRDVVVIGTSAGGINALQRLVAGLPPELPAAIFVVLHLPVDARSYLPRILDRAGPLPAAHAVDGEPIRPGRISVVPPNFHLVLEPGRVRLLSSPRENGVRPAIDPLFRSAAWAYRERVAGVMLSGTLDDGAAGLRTIKRHGGIAIVQDPAEAAYAGMPLHALRLVAADYCLPAAAIAPVLAELATAGGPAPATTTGEQLKKGGTAPVSSGIASNAPGRHTRRRPAAAGEPPAPPPPGAAGPLQPAQKVAGRASGLTCPECHGSLWEVYNGAAPADEPAGTEGNGALVGFECRVGHRYSLETMLAEQAREIEAAIWSAINILEERAALLRKQGIRAQVITAGSVVRRFEEQAREAEEHAETIRRTLLRLIQSMAPTGIAPPNDGTTPGDPVSP